jgi:hypothetical protein
VGGSLNINQPDPGSMGAGGWVGGGGEEMGARARHDQIGTNQDWGPGRTWPTDPHCS